jgi:hypothetical protein
VSGKLATCWASWLCVPASERTIRTDPQQNNFLGDIERNKRLGKNRANLAFGAVS